MHISDATVFHKEHGLGFLWTEFCVCPMGQKKIRRRDLDAVLTVGIQLPSPFVLSEIVTDSDCLF